MQWMSLLLGAFVCARVSCGLAEPSIAVEPEQGNVWSGSEVRVEIALDGFKGRRARVQWHIAVDDTVVIARQTRMRLRRGHGRRTLVVEVPEVKRRVAMSLLVIAGHGRKPVGPAVTSLTVFPPVAKEEFRDVFSGSDFYVYDPSGKLARLLEQLEIPFTRTSPAGFADTPGDAVIFLGGDAFRRGRLPPSEMLRLARDGKTFVVFAQDSLGNASEWKGAAIELLDDPVAVDAASWGAHPPQWASDIGDDVLRRWAGGAVGTALCSRPLAGNSVAWLTKPDDGLPLLMELWPGDGRIILCQCLIVEQFDAEPAAQLLLRNLLRYASTPATPSLGAALQLAYDGERERSRWESIGLYPEVLDADALLDAGSPAGSASLFLVGVKAEVIQHLQKQHLPPDEVRRRVFDAGATLLIVNAAAEDAFVIEKLLARPVVFNTGIDAPVRVNDDQRRQLTRGMTAGFVASALDVEAVNTVQMTTDGAARVELIGPGVVVKYELGAGSVIVCQVPFSEENESERRFYAQLLTNTGVRLSKQDNGQ